MKQQDFTIGQLYKAEFYYSDFHSLSNPSQYLKELDEAFSGVCLYVGSKYKGSTHYFYANGEHRAVDRGLLRCFKPWKNTDES